MKKLNKLQKDIAGILLKRIREEKYTISYDEIKAKIKRISNYEISDRVLWDSLGEVSALCNEMGLPPISVIAINEKIGCPGEGFFKNCHKLGLCDSDIISKPVYNKLLSDTKNCTEWYKLEEYLQLDITGDLEDYTLNDREPDSEGKLLPISINVYERSAYNRRECIKAKGTSCLICGFNFGETYGAAMSNKIHVHHIIPLSEIGDEHKVDPVKDLIPVCPNCHYVIHSKKDGVYTIEEVKNMIADNKRRSKNENT